MRVSNLLLFISHAVFRRHAELQQLQPEIIVDDWLVWDRTLACDEVAQRPESQLEHLASRSFDRLVHLEVDVKIEDV